jgi:hypothetical protein
MGPLHIRRFAGRVLLQDDRFEIVGGKFDASDGAYEVSGTASLGGVLNLKLMRTHAGGFTVMGPLDAPSVAQATAAEARAALKP